MAKALTTADKHHLITRNFRAVTIESGGAFGYRIFVPGMTADINAKTAPVMAHGKTPDACIDALFNEMTRPGRVLQTRAPHTASGQNMIWDSLARDFKPFRP